MTPAALTWTRYNRGAPMRVRLRPGGFVWADSYADYIQLDGLHHHRFFMHTVARSKTYGDRYVTCASDLRAASRQCGPTYHWPSLRWTHFVRFS